MNLKLKIVVLFLIVFSLTKCSKDKTNEPEDIQETFLCCTDENPFANLNVYNLDQSIGEISVIGVFTPNYDGVLDYFHIENLQLYTNNSLTIYDLNENIVFETQNGSDNFNGKNQTTNEDLPFGSYKYKIVVENEQTFLEYGYLCIIRNYENEADGHSFIDCLLDAEGNLILNDPQLR